MTVHNVLEISVANYWCKQNMMLYRWQAN